jgi:serine/threonine protein phosphatase PrpC
MAPIHITTTAFTDTGAVRPHNEDTVAVGAWLTGVPTPAPVVARHQVGAPLVCLVADGMGGHAAGEVASREVARLLVEQVPAATDTAALAECLRAANRALFELMDEQPTLRGMGTTVAGLSMKPAGILVFNVGDSRVYRVEDGSLTQLSTDDTPGPKLPDGRTAVYTTPQISQCLGGDFRRTDIEPHVLTEPLPSAGRWLICSDGLTDLLEPAAIASLIEPDDAASVTVLFEAAMAEGGTDNISLIIVRIEPAG